MSAVNEMLTEDHERAKTYLEGSLKVLGVAQVAGAMTDMVWGGGININFMNIMILITGIIFFTGGEALRKPLMRILKAEKKEEKELDYNQATKIAYSARSAREEYEYKKQQEIDNKFGFAKRRD